jgi:predicted dithiol-disulfide oxidoreductase (DUF899 family)
MQQHRIASREEWLAARKELLDKEKALTRLHDHLAAERRKLPWVRIEKPYVFETEAGKATLADLFEGRSQLIIRHFMLGPGWKAGCTGCSFVTDHDQGALMHLTNHDVSFVRVSRAPLPEIQAYNRRMGWKGRWVSSQGSDFNYDFHVAFRKEDGPMFYNYREVEFMGEDQPGLSIFIKDDSGQVYHTYSAFSRADEGAVSSYFYLDLTPKGRREDGPRHNLMDWVKRHDEYETAAAPASCCAAE